MKETITKLKSCQTSDQIINKISQSSTKSSVKLYCRAYTRSSRSIFAILSRLLQYVRWIRPYTLSNFKSVLQKNERNARGLRGISEIPTVEKTTQGTSKRKYIFKFLNVSILWRQEKWRHQILSGMTRSYLNMSTTCWFLPLKFCITWSAHPE